jgi:hypothetical protein
MAKIKYQAGTNSVPPVEPPTKLGTFMNNYGDQIVGAAGTLAPLLMKKPDVNAKPYKKGSNLIKYDEGNKKTKVKTTTKAKKDSSEYGDPELDQIVNIAQNRSNGSYDNSTLAPLETLSVNQERYSPDSVKARILKDSEQEQKQNPAKGEDEGYSAARSAKFAGVAGVAKALENYKGYGQNVIRKIGWLTNKALPATSLMMNAFNYTDYAGKDKKKLNSWSDAGQAGLQMLSDYLGIRGGRSLSRATLSPFRRRGEDAAKLRETVLKFEEAKSKYPETIENLLAQAREKDLAMPTAEKLQRLQDAQSGKIKYATYLAEAEANKPKPPRLKKNVIPPSLSARFKESFQKEGERLGNTFGLPSYVKSMQQMKKDEAMIRGGSKPKPTLSKEQKRERINDYLTQAATSSLIGLSGGTIGLGIKYALDEKNAEESRKEALRILKSKKSNKKN